MNLYSSLQDIQDTTQLRIHFSERIQDRNVNICLEMGHIIYTRTEGMHSLQHLTDKADASLYINHPGIIYKQHIRETVMSLLPGWPVPSPPSSMCACA